MRAIHDAHYATPPPDWVAYMYRLQYLAETQVGRKLRANARAEDAQVSAAMRAAGEL